MVLFPGATGAQTGRPTARLAGFWEDWLGHVRALTTEEERLVFLTLEDDLQRERFLEGFWAARGPDALARWSRNVRDAERLRSRSRAREDVVRWVGKPGSMRTVQRCGPLRRLEIWTWEPWQLALQGSDAPEYAQLVFAEATTLSMGSFAPWKPEDWDGLTRGSGTFDDLDSILEAAGRAGCIEGGSLGALRRDLEDALEVSELRRLVPWPSPDGSWLRERRERELRSSEVSLRLSYLGSYDRYTILRGQVLIPQSKLRTIGPGQLLDRLTITGDVYNRRGLVDGFRHVHHIAGAATGDLVKIEFYRRLPQGILQLHLRVADADGLALLRDELELDVPEESSAASQPPGYAGGLERLTRADHVQLDTFPSIEILPPTSDASGATVLRAILTGGPISSVRFETTQASTVVEAPPFTWTVRPVESATEVTATALDPRGFPLARDSRILEPAERPFRVRIDRVDLRADVAAVEVSLPEGQALDRLECRRRGRLVGRLTEAPFRCPIPGDDAGSLDYLTARAVLRSGAVQEDIVFLGERDPERVDVQLAELYVTIVDGAGRAASGLGSEDVRIWSEGRQRPVHRVQAIDDLPLNVSVLMDVSSSMGRDLRTAAGSAQDFFERILEPEDQASLLAFNHDFHRLVPFTSDPQRLRYGAIGLGAWGATRLHDAIAHALFQFSGTSSRRALIVLSDGADVGSDFPIAQVTDLAVRAGVSVFPIALGRFGDGDTSGLEELAITTGGRMFRVRSAAQLPDAYRRIESELRARYLVVFEPQGDLDRLLPRVDFEVLRQGYRVRDVRRKDE